MNKPTNPFEKHLFERIAGAIESWQNADFASDIYAIYLVCSLSGDDARFASVDSVAYLTNTHTTPELAKSYGSPLSPGCVAGETTVNACSPSLEEYSDYYPPGTDLRGDVLGRQLRDAYLLEKCAPLTLSDEESEAVSEHGTLQWKWNDNPGALDEPSRARLQALTERFDPQGEHSDHLVFDNRALGNVYWDKVLCAFLGACETVIRELHASGTIERICGKPVPIGIAFSNDIGAGVATEYTQRANPDGLPKEMLEWMRGETFATTEALEKLLEEIALRPVAERAQFWVDALLAAEESLYLGRDDALTQRLREAGLLDSFAIIPRLREYSRDVVSLLLPPVEALSSNASPVSYAEKSEHPDVKNCNIASALIGAIEYVAGHGGREQVQESDVERLHTLLQKLLDESHALPNIGMNMAVTARALHAMRPQRFPPDKFGGYKETAGRLLNWRDYALKMNDPNATDWNEATEKQVREQRKAERLRGLFG